MTDEIIAEARRIARRTAWNVIAAQQYLERSMAAGFTLQYASRLMRLCAKADIDYDALIAHVEHACDYAKVEKE